MAHLFDNARDETENLHQPGPKRRRWGPIAAVAGLALLVAASAWTWYAWDNGLPMLPSFTSSAAAPSATPAEVPDKPVGLKEFQTFRQQTNTTLQSLSDLAVAQQAAIKRLSEQLAALTAKVDALQRPVAPAPVAAPVPPPPPPAAQKRPAAAKPPPGISTGGAPLPLTNR